MLFFVHCVASRLPSVSFCCGHPCTSLCHMHHFDGGGWQMLFFAFLCIAFFFAVPIRIPPPSVSIQNFIFPPRKSFFRWVGGWFGLGGGGPPDQTPPPPDPTPVDKPISGRGT